MKLINKVLLVLILILTPLFSSAEGIDEKINSAFMPIADWWDALIFTEVGFGIFRAPLVLFLLIGGALFFTFYFKFVNIRDFWTAIKVVRGKYDDLEKDQVALNPQVNQIDGDLTETIKDESYHGEVNHFQALATAVSGTVGLGNITMVAVAISIGGPGATFWMIIAGILGMSTKFVECTLGVKYREIDAEGNVYGGPMYYMSAGMKDVGFPRLGKVLSYAFAVFCIGASFGGGNAFQSNQAAAQIITRFGVESDSAGTIIGLIFAVLVGIVIIGGIKRIAQVTEKVVPFMAGFYVLSTMVILVLNFSFIDDAIAQILSEAFTPRATVTGGVIGVMIQGFRRAAFSNEAGAGSAAIAHAAVNTKHAASEGLVALLEPFIDTVVICTMTALVIVIFNIDGAFQYGDVLNDEVMLTATGQRIGGVNLTSYAFDSTIPGFSYLLAIAVVLFAFSTAISWSYYGLQAWKYIFGKGKWIDISYKLIFLAFTVLGAAVTMEAVIKFSDAMILALVFPNMIGLFFLFRKVKEEYIAYKERIRSVS